MSAPTNNLPVNGVATAHHVTELVAVLADSVLALAARVDRAPLSVRVAAGDLQIEVTWPHGEIALSDLHVASDARANGSGAAAPGRGTTTPRTLAEPASSAITRPAENGTATTVENGTATTVLPQSAAEPGTFVLCAATVGVFYRAPEPGAKPFVDEGDAVTPGRQVAIVEAMKMMIPVEAERAGLVAEFLVPDATSVEYGQPLILFREADR
ncbi:acetyl-CoA carboxylase biotin carboxyl carrier protein [Nocardia acididurans]